MAKEQKAHLRYLSIAPRKVRLIADTLKKLSVSEAQAQLILRPHRTAEPLLKLLNSAISNAKNNGLNVEKLMVSRIWVDPAPVLQRSLPRSQGRATPILKRMSHVTIILSENENTKPSRFIIAIKEKKIKKESTPKKKGKVTGNIAPKPSADHEDHKKAETKKGQKAHPGGMFKRFFNRKSI
ncbi:MAG: 50S ribosomal protein L22 [bacterium]|nr:50S ribosomal protein L22 [bacterium]